MTAYRSWAALVAGGVFAVGVAVTPAGATQRMEQAGQARLTEIGLPADHPIYDPYLPLQQPGQQGQRLGYQPSELPRPEFRLALPKRRYAIGEPIWATLTVRNGSDKHAVRLSPPYVGQHVATGGVWRARWDWLRGGQFVGPLEVVPLNKGRRPHPPEAACYGGAPIVLKPGEVYTTTVPLNVAQQVDPRVWKDGGPQLAWFAGVGLTEPGRYRLYLQYANLERLVPFGQDPNKSALLPILKADEPQGLPFEAIVPKPVEVEVVPPQMKAWDALQRDTDVLRFVELLRAWEEAVLNTKDDVIGVPAMEPIRGVLDSLDESEVAVRQSLLLTKLRFELSGIDPADTHYAGKAMNVLNELQQLRPGVAAGPTSDAYDLTLCHALYAVGRKREAADLARRLGNPDGAVFLISKFGGRQ